jgi:hypothetical protein
MILTCNINNFTESQLMENSSPHTSITNASSVSQRHVTMMSCLLTFLFITRGCNITMISLFLMLLFITCFLSRDIVVTFSHACIYKTWTSRDNDCIPPHGSIYIGVPLRGRPSLLLDFRSVSQCVLSFCVCECVLFIFKLLAPEISLFLF